MPYLMELVRSGWTTSGVWELRPDLLTVLLILWVTITVLTVKMLGFGVEKLSLLVLKEPSDFNKVQLLLKAVLRSATTTSGGQCVMTYGILLMLKWFADNWD